MEVMWRSCHNQSHPDLDPTITVAKELYDPELERRERLASINAQIDLVFAEQAVD